MHRTCTVHIHTYSHTLHVIAYYVLRIILSQIQIYPYRKSNNKQQWDEVGFQHMMTDNKELPLQHQLARPSAHVSHALQTCMHCPHMHDIQLRPAQHDNVSFQNVCQLFHNCGKFIHKRKSKLYSIYYSYSLSCKCSPPPVVPWL